VPAKRRLRAGPRPAVAWRSLLLVGAFLAVPFLGLMVVPEAEAATTKTLTITSATAHPTVAFATFDSPSPKVFDIDGDGDLEIIAQNDNQWVYVFDSRNGALLAEMKTTFPSGWGARSMNPPEVAILSGDGKVHLIVANSAATITSYTYEPVGSTSTHFVFKKDWQRRLSDCYSNPGMDSKPVLADLDKDGRLEILGATEESGIYALRMDGSLYWKKCIGGGNAEPSVGDLNQDGWPDVVFGSDGGTVTAMSGRTGGTMWSFYATSRFNLRSGAMPVGVAIGQLDGLGGPDVVVGARDSHDTTNFENDHALLLALSSSGALLWGRQDPIGNPLTYTHPIIVDAAKDGQPEVYWADWNTVGHKGGVPPEHDWQTTGPANFYRYDKTGKMVWRQTIPTFWNNKDIPLADVDADGVQEMLANGPGSNGHDGIWYLDTRTGARETWVDLYPYKVNRAPVVADLYKTGRMQWVLEVAPSSSGVGAHGIVVYDTGSPYDSAWPHLPYPSRGTGGGTTSSSTSTSPTSSSSTSTGPTSSTTTSGGEFAAPFTAFRGNEWWVQAQVGTNGPAISKVDVRIGSGSWMPLSKQAWGSTPPSWAGSYHFPQGSILQMRATATDGQSDLSSCRQWIPPPDTDATIVACGTTTTTSGSTFSASFTPAAVGNDWWVEVGVAGNQPLSTVEAKVDSGAWTALVRQDWGNWAKSINAPNGSQVTFRATSTNGATATSAPVTWT
jgi:hypothetical protein